VDGLGTRPRSPASSAACTAHSGSLIAVHFVRFGGGRVFCSFQCEFEPNLAWVFDCRAPGNPAHVCGSGSALETERHRCQHVCVVGSSLRLHLRTPATAPTDITLSTLIAFAPRSRKAAEHSDWRALHASQTRNSANALLEARAIADAVEHNGWPVALRRSARP
jgi:hypothetical protein